MKTITITFGKKQKHGVWKRSITKDYIECSVCGVCLPADATLIMIPRYNYCPKCGAKMYCERRGE